MSASDVDLSTPGSVRVEFIDGKSLDIVKPTAAMTVKELKNTMEKILDVKFPKRIDIFAKETRLSHEQIVLQSSVIAAHALTSFTCLLLNPQWTIDDDPPDVCSKIDRREAVAERVRDKIALVIVPSERSIRDWHYIRDEIHHVETGMQHIVIEIAENLTNPVRIALLPDILTPDVIILDNFEHRYSTPSLDTLKQLADYWPQVSFHALFYAEEPLRYNITMKILNDQNLVETSRIQSWMLDLEGISCNSIPNILAVEGWDIHELKIKIA